MPKKINGKIKISEVSYGTLTQMSEALEVYEQRLLCKMFEYLKNTDYKTKKITLNIDDFYRDFKRIVDKKITREDFKNLIDSTQRKIPYIITGDDFLRTAWYSTIWYSDKENMSILFCDDVIDYAKKRYSDFSVIRLESIYAFKKMYSVGIYEFLKKHSQVGTLIEVSVADFKEFLDISDNTGYKNFANFKKYVLEPVFDEINEKSELRVSYETVKKGNRVDILRFKILDEI